jgi:hypothetical protein
MLLSGSGRERHHKRWLTVMTPLPGFPVLVAGQWTVHSRLCQVANHGGLACRAVAYLGFASPRVLDCRLPNRQFIFSLHARTRLFAAVAAGHGTRTGNPYSCSAVPYLYEYRSMVSQCARCAPCGQ